MSRIGKLPIVIPDGTSVSVSGQTIEAKGKHGTRTLVLPEVITPTIENGELFVRPRADLMAAAHAKIKANEEKGRKPITFGEALDTVARTQWGTARANAANLVQGVTTGFTRTLELVGVGYRAAMQGPDVKLALGFSHDVIYKAPPGITIRSDKATEIVVSGADKQTVGQVAAELRKFRPPEPYKGKGVRYQGEYVRRKEGKKK